MTGCFRAEGAVGAVVARPGGALYRSTSPYLVDSKRSTVELGSVDLEGSALVESTVTNARRLDWPVSRSVMILTHSTFT